MALLSDDGSVVKFILVDKVCLINPEKINNQQLVYSTINVGYWYRQYLLYQKDMVGSKVPFSELECHLVYFSRKLNGDLRLQKGIEDKEGDLEILSHFKKYLQELKENQFYAKEFANFFSRKQNSSLINESILKEEARNEKK